MQTSVTKRGQTVIPSSIRKKYHIDAGVRLVWLDDGDTIRVVPVPHDPLISLRGCGREKTIQKNYWGKETEIEVAKTHSINLETNVCRKIPSLPSGYIY